MEDTKLIRKENDLAPFPDLSLSCHVPWSKPLPAAGLQLSPLCLRGLSENKSLALEERCTVGMQCWKAVSIQLQALGTLVNSSHFATIKLIIIIVPIGLHEKKIYIFYCTSWCHIIQILAPPKLRRNCNHSFHIAIIFLNATLFLNLNSWCSFD